MAKKIKYDSTKVPVSEETIKGMSLNINDLAWFERRLSLQEAAFSEEMEALFNGFADKLLETVNDHNKLVFDAIDKLTRSVDNLGKEICNVNKRIDDIEVRVQVLEKIVFSEYKKN